ncbi:MAG: hypothetical protein NUW22_05160 [Acidobacteria bacterium]|nr:hypothetical protein [Acidobacteriota bacterium]
MTQKDLIDQNPVPPGDLARAIDEQEIRALAARSVAAQNQNIVELCDRALAGDKDAWTRALDIASLSARGLWPSTRPLTARRE